jgi:hypothetical protein
MAHVVFSTVYTLEMPSYVYVQLRGVEKAAVVEANEVEDTSPTPGDARGKLLLKKNGKTVAEFGRTEVVGWWKQSDSD